MTALTPEQERAVRKIVAEVLATSDLEKSRVSIEAFARIRDEEAVFALGQRKARRSRHWYTRLVDWVVRP